MILYSYSYHKAHVHCIVYNEIPGIPMAHKLELKSLLSGIARYCHRLYLISPRIVKLSVSLLSSNGLRTKVFFLSLEFLNKSCLFP